VELDTPPQAISISEKFKYDGSGTELAFLMFKNLLLTVLTLGIYAAWARTNTRRYLWGQTSFLGDRATYTGQGKELFKGWVIVSGIYLLFAIGLNVLQQFVSPMMAILIVPLYMYIYSLILYGGTRYRVSKTTWRGIKFGVDKDKPMTREFIALVFKYGIISMITMGIGLPMLIHETRKFLTNRMRLGSAYFRYEADRREFCMLCYKGVFFCIITLGFYLPWFHARLIQFRLEKTSIQNASFKVHLRGKDLFLYTICSFVLGLVTLGLATPWILNWGNKLIINSIELSGEMDFDSIQNMASDGEAMADVAAVEYDIDLAF
jgi:uncharacterized membrane protein YjgN (DUF898 family)